MSKVFSLPHGPLNWFASAKDFTGDNNLGPFATEMIQRYIFGTRNITWDGRVFKYGHAAAECQSGYGAYNYALVNISAVLAANAAAGDRRVKVTVTSGGYAASGVIAKDELAGGHIVLNNGVEDPYNMMIVGNDADVAATTCMLDLEWPLPAALTTSAYAEVLLNPYAHLYGGITIGASEKMSVMGIPKVNLVATYNGWIQTWGPCWVTPPSGATAPGYANGDRQAYFLKQGNGSIIGGASGTVEDGLQPAGFIMQRDVVGNNAGPPFIMLQISI